MILNHPSLMLRESTNHYKTKLMIGELADKELSPLALKRNFDVYVAYEMQFDALWVEKDTKKPRLYQGDVVILLFGNGEDDLIRSILDLHSGGSWYALQNAANVILNIEIDGYMGHDSLIKRSNNSLRDDELKKQFGIFVHRMQLQTAAQRASWQNETLEEIIKFYYKSLDEYHGRKNTTSNNHS